MKECSRNSWTLSLLSNSRKQMQRPTRKRLKFGIRRDAVRVSSARPQSHSYSRLELTSIQRRKVLKAMTIRAMERASLVRLERLFATPLQRVNRQSVSISVRADNAY